MNIDDAQEQKLNPPTNIITATIIITMVMMMTMMIGILNDGHYIIVNYYAKRGRDTYLPILNLINLT